MPKFCLNETNGTCVSMDKCFRHMFISNKKYQKYGIIIKWYNAMNFSIKNTKWLNSCNDKLVLMK